MNETLIKKYTYLNNNRIITYNDQNKIFIKKKKKYDIEKIYHYLDSHEVPYYLKPLKITDKELYFNYLESRSLKKDELAKRLVYVLSILQNKTTTYQDLDKDLEQAKYDKYKQTIIYLEKYYYTLQDMLELKVYLAPSEYLFIRNVSIIYQALNYVKSILDTWYDLIKKTKVKRVVFCHGKCELDHFLYSDNEYFISLENAHQGEVYEDFLYFYNHNYNDTDMFSNFKFYQHKYQYNKLEFLEFIINLVMPIKIDIYPSSLEKCILLTEYFDKLKKISDFVLQNQKNYQDDEKNKFHN